MARCPKATQERKDKELNRSEQAKARMTGPLSTNREYHAARKTKGSEANPAALTDAKQSRRKKAIDPATDITVSTPLAVPHKRFFSNPTITSFVCDGADCGKDYTSDKNRTRNFRTHVKNCRHASAALKQKCLDTKRESKKPKPSADRIQSFVCDCGKAYSRSKHPARDYPLHVDKCMHATAARKQGARTTYRARERRVMAERAGAPF